MADKTLRSSSAICLNYYVVSGEIIYVTLDCICFKQNIWFEERHTGQSEPSSAVIISLGCANCSRNVGLNIRRNVGERHKVGK